MVRPSATGRPLERPLLVLCQRGTVVAAAAAPRAVHAHLVGKLALADAALRRSPGLRAACDALDTAAPWAETGTSPLALGEAFAALPDAAESSDRHGTPLDEDEDAGGEWTKVWRDKRF